MPMAMASEKVGDALSLYVWREPARRLAATGLDANALAGASVALGVLAFLLFWRGHFAVGVVCAAAAIIIEIAGDLRERRQALLEFDTRQRFPMQRWAPALKAGSNRCWSVRRESNTLGRS